MNNQILLSVKNLKKTFVKDKYEIKVLEDVTFNLSEGEFATIMGRSGAGKTTLLQIIGTLEKPTSGEIYFQQSDLMVYDETEINYFRNAKIGFVFQFHYLIQELTAIENVILPAMLYNAKEHLEKYYRY